MGKVVLLDIVLVLVLATIALYSKERPRGVQQVVVVKLLPSTMKAGVESIPLAPEVVLGVQIDIDGVTYDDLSGDGKVQFYRTHEAIAILVPSESVPTALRVQARTLGQKLTTCLVANTCGDFQANVVCQFATTVTGAVLDRSNYMHAECLP